MPRVCPLPARMGLAWIKTMATTPVSGAGNSSGPSEAPRRGSWTRSLILFLAIVIVYSSSDRDLGTYDTAPSAMMLLTLARREGVYLDRFRPILHDTNHVMPAFATPWHGHILSRYPVAPAIVAQPLVIPQIAFLDWYRPAWDRAPRQAFELCKTMGKWSMTVLMALAAVILHRLLIGLGLSRVALPAVIAAALGSNLWSVASQAMWQHGPAALALIAAVALLHPAPVTRWKLALAGV